MTQGEKFNAIKIDLVKKMFNLWFPRQKNINQNIKDELLIL